ncbi:MAG: penicillin-binding protein 2 [Deltaproteobacteria bacterium]|nr:penicillin-binding protein 2 [Deltaproteobacteria bacterium]
MALDEIRGGRLGAGLDPAIESRIPFVAGFMVVVFGIFGLRLFQLQIIEGEQFGRLSLKNSVRSVQLEAPRGDIVDREGRTLATTRPAFGIQVIPTDLRERERTVKALGILLDADSAALDEKIGTPRGRSRFQPVKLARDVSYDELARVESHRYALPGVVTDIQPRRHYVEGEFASHLIGYIGEIQGKQLEQDEFEDYRSGEVIGQTGIEKLLEQDLRGRKGGRNLVVDVAGRIVDVLDEEFPVPGGTIMLTIDRDLQKVAEDAFLPEVLGEPGKLGAVVALDVRNGDVLALVSKPSFDPNDFSGGIDTATWNQLSNDEWRPIQNRAVSGQYPPGSIYKAIVAAAALQHGIDPDEPVYCPGKFKLGRRTFHCWKREGHGSVDLRDAIKNSCDVYFYQIGLKLGVDRLAEMAKAFFFGRRTGIAIGQERAGLVPTREWKKRRFRESWMKGETLNVAIGQGFNLTTPLQVAVAYAAIANGGKIFRPRLIRQTIDRDGVVIPGPPVELLGTVPVDARHLARIVDALESVVGEEGGTARRARVPGIRVAGKTGTVQVVRLKHVENLKDDEIPIRFRDHAWFVGFAPVEAPEIVVAALVEHGGGGARVAAPITQKVLARYFAGRVEAAPAVEVLESEAGSGSGPAGEEAMSEVVDTASGGDRARN